MKRLELAGLHLKPSKCKLIQRAVSYLAHHIGANGLRPDQGRLHALSNRPGKTTRPMEIASFVGFCSYYRRFVKNFAGLSKPLHKLTQNYQRFYWNENCQRPPKNLEDEFLGSPILSLQYYEKLFFGHWR